MSKIDQDKIRELQKLLDRSIIDPEEAKRIASFGWENAVSEKKPIPHQIAPTNAFHSQSDNEGRCPHCYQNGKQNLMGSTIIDGSEKPTYHCTSCNKVYTELPAAIKIIADEAIKLGAETVGFVRADHTHTVSNVANNNTNDYQSHQKLDQVNSNLSMMSGNISSLNYTLQDLMEQVRRLAEQNNKMMEQLANDPLIHMRKTITEFDLK